MQKKHSPLGIASFVIAVISAIGLIASAAAAVNIASGIASETNFDPAAASAETLPPGFGALAVVSGLVFIFVLAALVGALLGLVGLYQKDRLKLFSILGLAVNAGLAFLVIIIFFIGMLTAPALPL